MALAFVALGWGWLLRPSLAQKPSLALPSLLDPLPPGDWCRYPTGKPRPPQVPSPTLLPVAEVEPNDTVGTAQVVPLGSAAGQDIDLDISGSLSVGTDVDFYQFTLLKGDVIGMAALGGGAPDTILRLTDSAGIQILEDDDHGGIAGIYPPGSPFPGGVSGLDSAMTWVAPAAGTYLARVTSFLSGSSGSYTLQMRVRRPAFEAKPLGATQTIFLDFDGATINASALFGSGNNPRSSRVFLRSWPVGGSRLAMRARSSMPSSRPSSRTLTTCASPRSTATAIPI